MSSNFLLGAFALLMLGSTCLASGDTPGACTLRLIVDEDRMCSAIYCKPKTADRNSYILTAYHCVMNSKKVFLAFDEASVLKFPLLEFVEPKFVAVPEADLAIFRCTEAGSKKLEEKRGRRVVVAGDDAKEAERVVITGNPVYEIFSGTNQAHKIFPLNYVDDGVVSAKGRLVVFLGATAAKPAAHDTELLIIGTKQVAPGFSGGPVLRQAKDGYELVGLVQGGDPSNPIRSWAIPVSTLMAAANTFEKAAIGFPPSIWPEAAIDGKFFKYQAEFIKLEASGVAGEFAGKWDVYLDGRVVRQVKFGPTKDNEGDYEEMHTGTVVRADYYKLEHNRKTLQLFKTANPAIVEQGLLCWINDDGFFYKIGEKNFVYHRRQDKKD